MNSPNNNSPNKEKEIDDQRLFSSPNGRYRYLKSHKLSNPAANTRLLNNSNETIHINDTHAMIIVIKTKNNRSVLVSFKDKRKMK